MSVHSKIRVSPHQVPGNLIQMLCRYAEERSDQPAFIYLLDGQSNQAVLTYAQLEQRARAIAAHLQNMGLAGQRVLLVYPPGLDFITAFFGCLYAGCVAVPTYPPHRHRMLNRFHTIAADAGAGIALSTSSAAIQFQGLIAPKNGQADTCYQIRWLATDEIPDVLAERWSEPAITSDTLAMLQYTSGSTSQPKGVMISHANLIDNTSTIHNAFGIQQQHGDSGVFWLPTYHDMGLVGGVLVPMFAGGTNVLISPADFLQKPITWLAVISKYRATISGGPNFAYDLCVRNITDEQRATLDLSSWAVAFIGAEPIQPAMLERFAAAFAPCGFKPSAFYPCYGLAEATLLVSGARRGSGATVQSFHDTALTENHVEPVPDSNAHARRLVACGSPVGTMRVIIVNSKTSIEAAPGCVGEIWVAGTSVGQGYWHNPRLTSRSFNAHLSNTGEGPFLRTGDLGFMNDGQLYITGRREDLIIVRGLNRYPQDIEATARMSHPLLEVGYGAAFAVDDHGTQRLILVQEVRQNGKMNFNPVLDAIRMAVLDEHDLALDTIVLVRSGTIPKTSSGKVQRHICRGAFLSGELKTIAEYSGTMVENADPGDTISTGIKDADSSIPRPAPNYSQLSAFTVICQHAHALAGAALPALTPNTPIIALGLDSLQRLELVAAIEKTFGGYMPDAAYCQVQTLGELAQAIQEHLIDGPKSDVPAGQILPEHYDFAQFPEYAQLKRQERMLLAVTGDNPYFRVDQGGTGSAACINGRQLINFCVYDYVGMSHDPEVAAAAKSAIDRYGTSAGASRLISGEKQVHHDLEQALAAFLNVPAAIVFVSGHATNVTTIGHLLGPDDLILHDNLAHNSIIQGAELSGATRRSFAHNDWMAMDAVLSECRHRYRRVLIAIEGVYSMDGDFPDLPRFVELKKKHKALMLVDEAHSLGTMGPTGRGIGEYWGVARADVDLWMGTLSKSLASCGGYIAGSVELVEYLKYTAPGFVYSVGISPPNAAAALASLMVLQRQPQRVNLLHELSALFLKLAGQRGLDTGLAAGTPVIPVIIGGSAKSLRLSKALFQRGINVQPILYPVVPEHAARLRFFITTNHTRAQIHTTVSAIADELNALDQHSGFAGE
ncbi:MAG: aminotransferase class I/II-fold pyridoxal phosphate-dependent enzyme [Sedimentisphaerales bacterium]|jgi:8-amino-7-oxononanoate synthase